MSVQKHVIAMNFRIVVMSKATIKNGRIVITNGMTTLEHYTGGINTHRVVYIYIYIHNACTRALPVNGQKQYLVKILHANNCMLTRLRLWDPDSTLLVEHRWN